MVSSHSPLERPSVIHDPESKVAITAGQCDACPPTILLSRSSHDTSPNKAFVNTLTYSINLDTIHYAVNSQMTAGAFVLNQSALAFLEFFNKPRYWENVPQQFLKEWGVVDP